MQHNLHLINYTKCVRFKHQRMTEKIRWCSTVHSSYTLLHYWWSIRILFVTQLSTGYFLWGRGASPHSVPNHHRGRSAGLHPSGWGTQEQEISGGSAALCEEVEHLQGAGHRAAGQPAGDSRQVRTKLDDDVSIGDNIKSKSGQNWSS